MRQIFAADKMPLKSGDFSHNLVAGAVHIGYSSVVGFNDTDEKIVIDTGATVAGIHDTGRRRKMQ